MKKEKLYDPEKTGTFEMMFGMKNTNNSGKKYMKKRRSITIKIKELKNMEIKELNY
tara:strand:+ start:409 stop:576 length:168 start_codon:yes stop_codon:yes gene_type:complete